MQLKPILTYSEVEKEYGIKIAGFGRGINVTDKSIVLISYIKNKKMVYLFIMISGRKMVIISTQEKEG